VSEKCGIKCELDSTVSECRAMADMCGHYSNLWIPLNGPASGILNPRKTLKRSSDAIIALGLEEQRLP
jgi:hypothetical protein